MKKLHSFTETINRKKVKLLLLKRLQKLKHDVNEKDKVLNILNILHDDFERSFDNRNEELQRLLYQFKKLSSKVDKLKVVQKTLKSLKNKMETLKDDNVQIKLDYLYDYRDIKSKVKKLQEKYDDYTYEYRNLLKQSGKCPTCFSTVDDKLLDDVFKTFDKE